MMIEDRPKNGRQIRAARTILGLTILETAKLSKLNRNTIMLLESRRSIHKFCPIAKRVASVFMDRGIEFVTINNKSGILFQSKNTIQNIAPTRPEA